MLFVQRDRVTEQEILKVARALADVGDPIRSVQQRSNRPDQIQLGTIVPIPNRPAFAGTKPLDLDALAALSGDAFWRAAFNGQAWCDAGPGKTTPCFISSDGRPVHTRPDHM